MYESFYGFGEKPFTLIPDPDFLYLSKRHRGALNMLEFALTGQAGFTVISGEVGSGKTTVVRRFLELVDEDITIGLITNTHRSIGELLQWVLLAFGLDYTKKDKIELYNDFIAFLMEQYVANRHPVLIIDEAQNLDVETLEELRVLSNIYDGKEHVLQIILIGQQELSDKLRLPELRQLAQRISVSFHLGPLTFKETVAYIRHRLLIAGGSVDFFDDMACAAVYYFSKGVPRLINILCDSSLVYGFADEQRHIGIDIVLHVVSDRRESGLSLFASADDKLDRETVITNIGEMLAATSDEEEPEAYLIGKRNDDATPSEAPSSGRDEQELPAMIDLEPGIAEPSSDDDLPDIGFAADFAETYQEPVPERRRVGAFTLSISAVTLIGIVGVFLGLGWHSKVADFFAQESATSVLTQIQQDQEEQDPVLRSNAIGVPVEKAPADSNDEAGRPREQPPVAEIAANQQSASAAGHSTEVAADPGSSTDDGSIARTETRASVRQIMLDDLFDLADSAADRETADATLFALWNIDYVEYLGDGICDEAANSGLMCLEGEESLAGLRGLNRPTLITLTTPDGRRFHAVISSFDGSTVSLQAAGQTVISTMGTIATIWSGEYVLLWKPPAVYRRMMKSGLHGEDVAWLKKRLEKMDGVPNGDADDAVFDSQLKERVITFQRRHALRPDGIVGPRTIIKLNTADQIDGIPLLEGPRRQYSDGS